MSVWIRYTASLAFMLLFVSQTGFAQKPDWIRNSEMTDNFGITSSKRVAVHLDGSVFVLGQYYGTNTIGGQPLNSFPNTIDDGFLAKYNPQGDLLWVKQLFQSTDWYSNRVLDLKVDHQGDLIFSGSCLWPSSILGSQTGVGQFIAKIDKDGNLLWLNFPPLPGGSIAEHDTGRKGNRIGFDPDHNILWLTDRINEFAPSGGLAVLKFKPDGTQLATMFVTRNATFYRPHIHDFSVDATGNFIITGSFPFTVAFTGGPSLTNTGSNLNPRQFFVVKFAADGTFQWVVYSNFQANIATSHTVDQAGNAYVGLQLGAGSVIYTPHGTINIPQAQRSIARITPDGRLDWMESVGLVNLNDLVFGQDGLLYVTGSSFGDAFRYQSYTRTKSSNGSAAFVMKINTGGNFHGLYLGEPEDDPDTQWGPSVEGRQSVVDASGNIYTIGNFWDRQVWGCVPALTKEHAFYLIKHTAAESPIRTITGPSSVCTGTSITLTTDLISNGVLYKWFTPDQADPGPGTVLNNEVTWMTDRAYHKRPVIVSITDNCDEYFAEPFVLNILAPPDPPQLTTSKPVVCPGTAETYSIGQAQSDAMYQWTLPEGVSAPALTDSGGLFQFAPDFVHGEVQILVSNICGSAETTFHIGTHATPEIPVITGDEFICPGITQIQKSIAPVLHAVEYVWELPPFITFNPSFSQNQPVLHALVESGFQSGEIRVRAVGKCKTSDTSLPIVISRVPNPGNAEELSGPIEFCTTTGKVQYTLPPIENAILYTWTIPDMFYQQGTQYTTEPYVWLDANSAGSGSLTVSGTNHCQVNGSAATLLVTTYEPLPVPKLTISTCDHSLTVSEAIDFTWYVNGVSAPHLTETTLVLSDSGSYYVEVENFCGVKASNEIMAYPVLTSRILIPNVITPDGDGKNDYLKIDKSLQHPRVRVLNRWGDSLFTATAYQNDWNGGDLAPGVYYLVVEHPCLPQGYRGWLSVIK